MRFVQHFGKHVSILTLSLFVGTLAGTAVAGQPGGTLAASADRAGDALSIGTPAATLGASKERERGGISRLAAFGTNQAGDALPIGAPPVAAGSATVAESEERAVGGTLRAAAEQAGDALPIGTPVASAGRQEKMAGRKTGDTVN